MRDQPPGADTRLVMRELAVGIHARASAFTAAAALLMNVYDRGVAAITRTRVRGLARVCEAVCLLAVTGAAQRWVPMTRWGRVLGSAGEVPGSWRGQVVQGLPARPASTVEAKVSLAITRGSRVLPWQPTCLAQAAAGQVMLRRRGTPGVVVIGLRPQTGSAWDAHAWLLGGRGALTGGPAARGFTAATVYEVPGELRASDIDL